MSILVWLIMGATAGWLASVLTGNNARQGMFGNIVVGGLGAFIGGWFMHLIGKGGADLTTFNWYSFFVAVGGAVILLMIFNAIRSKG